ncbi:MAG: DUF4129 domain-containing protein [Bacteroidetes bacterium]|nr:DUF4129 domain-containing protein [Bacteroidota bacterium]
MAWKLNKANPRIKVSWQKLHAFFCIFIFFQHTIHAQNFVETEPALETGQKQPTKGTLQKTYESNEPGGKNIDQDAVKKEVDKLLWQQKEKIAPQKINQQRITAPKPSVPASGISTTFIYILAIGAIAALLVWILLKSGKGNRKIKKEPLAALSHLDDIEKLTNLELNPLLDAALREGNYRLAVRILYLQNLQLLFKKNVLVPSNEKTNMDYLRELGTAPYYDLFQYLTRVFDYVWYGESHIDSEGYKVILPSFQNLHAKIESRQ